MTSGPGSASPCDAVAPADPRQLCALLRTCLDSLVTALDTAPDTPLHAVPVLDQAERAQVVEGWNDTGGAGARPHGAGADRRRGRRATPDAVAVACGDAVLSYAGAGRRGRAGWRGGWPRRGRARSGWSRCVMERGIGLVTALVAVVKAGAAYLPVDPGYPAERVGFMLRRRGPGW